MMDARQAIRGRTFYRLSGQPVTMDDLLPLPSSNKSNTGQEGNVAASAVVVFLRSLG
jgi:hypothetical protein